MRPTDRSSNFCRFLKTRGPWEHRRGVDGKYEVPDLTFDWPRVLEGSRRWGNPATVRSNSRRGENGKVRLRRRSSLQGLAHPLPLAWPFSSLFSWMDQADEETNNRKKDTALPQLTMASYDRSTALLDIGNLIAGIFILDSSARTFWFADGSVFK